MATPSERQAHRQQRALDTLSDLQEAFATHAVFVCGATTTYHEHDVLLPGQHDVMAILLGAIIGDLKG